MYNALGNDITGMAAFMQKPQFDDHAPPAFNFGHEITHGFDTHGRHYGAYGEEENFWSNHSAEHFDKEEECFMRQFSSVPIYGDLADGHQNTTALYDNGTKCLGES